ncbi:MAG: response regulator [Tannerella sp.]|jgi:signal transduction histidine kinase/DNA-binding response OmpR family regulator/ligand-binding sensor domain-containing protein|nr:response regulator [Tannerella sp.]
MRHTITAFALLTFIAAHADNLRRIGSRDGLSNSSVIYLYQDNERFLWIGTFDGLNMYDGRNIQIYKPDINNRNSLSGNVIRKIIETDGNYLWINTKWGLNKLSKRKNIVEEYYDDFKENASITRDTHDNLYVLGKTGILSVYDRQLKCFIDIPLDEQIECEDITGFFMIDTALFINHRGKLKKYSVSFDGRPHIIRHPDFEHHLPIERTFYDRGRILYIDIKGDLYIKNAVRTLLVANISRLLGENGSLASVIMDGNNILMGFKTTGVYRLNAQKNYEIEKLDISCGVFYLLKDDVQNIVWIATDGQGLFALSEEDYSFESINLMQLPVKKRRPVRAICTDHQNSLWLGTKDNGIIRIKNYEEFSPGNVTHFTTETGLCNDAVFAFAPSCDKKLLYIGSDGPEINYYSYLDNKIHTLRGSSMFNNVHSLFETPDSVLWAGAGSALLKARIRRDDSFAEISSCQTFVFNLVKKQAVNQIYTLYPDNDSIIWAGIRGNGLLRFNCNTGAYRLITFEEKGIAPMNDILCIHKDRNGTFWLGTSYGLTRFRIDDSGAIDYRNYNENNGFPNNTIHGIIENSDGDLWLSSNNGIIVFNPVKETARIYNEKTGLTITEFCDNAWFRCAGASEGFFGAVDGVVRIKYEEKQRRRFFPKIHFTKLRIFNQEYNIHDYENRGAIELQHNQNSFAVSFVAPDFIYGGNGKYTYNLENMNSIWMDSWTGEAQFTNIPHGNYTLKVRYNDGIWDDQAQTGSIAIRILPPFYLTVYAKLLYLLVAVLLLAGIFVYLKNKYENKRALIAKEFETKYREEAYESKLRFFTSITHEFSTPLTLIYGPCERLLRNSGLDGAAKKYIEIIKSNAERLNTLIQEIIDFRRVETGHSKLRIETADIGRLTAELAAAFSELAEQNSISFDTSIPPSLQWNTDTGCYSKIVTNLISNAFKYTPVGGAVRVSVENDGELLVLKVYNTGAGIPDDKIPLLFNRYSVLDNVKENSIKGLSSRNGLGLAICHSLTELLHGTITVNSRVDEYAEFVVTLPLAPSDSSEALGVSSESLTPGEALTNPGDAITKPDKLLIIDDNPDLLWMLTDILSEEYEIVTAGNGKQGLALIETNTPDLIITDIMMPEIDGITLARKIKSDRYTQHIPLVILSARNNSEDRIEGLESGADAYVPKPFDADYLKAVVRRQLDNKKRLEHYYNSAASAYSFSDGRLLHNEDRDFMQRAAETVAANIDNENFTTEALAEALQLSVRNLYRRFKDLQQPTPNDFIKDLRLRTAAKMLITTNLTVQEIMYRTGFSNRSHFHREFTKLFNASPKSYRLAQSNK